MHELPIRNLSPAVLGANGDQDPDTPAQILVQEGPENVLGELRLGVQYGHCPELCTIHLILCWEINAKGPGHLKGSLQIFSRYIFFPEIGREMG